MKKVLMTMVAMMVLSTASAQVQPFIRGGIGVSEFWLNNADGTNSAFSYQVGAGIEMPFKNSKWGFQPVLQVSSKGAKDNGSNLTIHFTYLELPLDAYYKTALGEKWGLKIGADPYLSYGIGGKTSAKEGHASVSIDSFGSEMGFRRFDAGLNWDVSFTYKKFFFGTTYDMGFVPIHKKVMGETFPSNYNALVNVGIYL